MGAALEKKVEGKADRLKSVTQEKHRLKPVLRGLEEKDRLTAVIGFGD
jgi:hypothetical protein